VFDGFVVCSELAETLMDAWNVDVEERAKKEADKKEKRALDNWKKLIKGMLMHQKIRNKYLGKEKK
jgi:xeroderma pigmentosum group C-complementing protein